MIKLTQFILLNFNLNPNFCFVTKIMRTTDLKLYSLLWLTAMASKTANCTMWFNLMLSLNLAALTFFQQESRCILSPTQLTISWSWLRSKGE